VKSQYVLIAAVLSCLMSMRALIALVGRIAGWAQRRTKVAASGSAGMARLTVLASTGLCVACKAGALSAASFMPLGNFPGIPYGSHANDISSDGQVIVGDDEVTGEYYLRSLALRWVRGHAAANLGHLYDTFFATYAYGTNADGSVVVGSSGDLAGPYAFRWTSAGGMVNINPDRGDSAAFAVSDDGEVVVGHLSGGAASEAFRWTSSGGTIRLGHLPSTDRRYSSALNVSADGSFVVGHSTAKADKLEAFRWTSNAGMVGLGHLPGKELVSEATAISADGSVVVGWSSDSYLGPGALTREAFRWTSDEGMVGLGDLPGGVFQSWAADVSPDGSVVVGSGSFVQGQEAVVWDRQHGMRSIKSLLTDQGIDLTGWRLTEATAIAADGFTVVGNGRNPAGGTEAWIADIRSVPEPVIGDFNQNGIVDAADYVVWRNGLGTTYTQNDYDLWRSNFGRAPSAGWPAGSSAAIPLAEPLSAQVPEPSAVSIVLVCALGLVACCRLTNFSRRQ
jgi:probable HAF family extracellular repeat protein